MIKKHELSKLFLYKQRFVIGYVLLVLAFLMMIFGLPVVSPIGISKSEMGTIVSSQSLSLSGVLHGDVVDLPYRILQKLCVSLLGLNSYAIKLPSVIFAAILAFFLVLLLNRWFKSNVALVSSVLIVLSVPFLYLAGVGESSVVFVLMPVVILWLGSKIHKETKPKPIWLIWFSFLLAVSLSIPQMIYFVIAVVAYVAINPHFRFSIKAQKWFVKILLFLNILIGAVILGVLIFNHRIDAILFGGWSKNLNVFFDNIRRGTLPFLMWNGVADSMLLSPLIGMPVFAVILVGLIANLKKFFRTKLFLAVGLVIFGVTMTGIRQENALFLIVPAAILLAYGMQYIFERWYDIFPENPYAKLFALLPISLFLGVVIVNNFLHFVFGYKYTPTVAGYFNHDLDLISENLQDGDVLLASAGSLEYDFYKISKKFKVLSDMSEEGMERVLVLRTWSGKVSDRFKLQKIITSSKMHDSDRIYVYTVKD